MTDVAALVERILEDPDCPDAFVTVQHEQAWREVLTRHLTGARRSGDRILPMPYNKLGAADREVWLICEGIYDGALTADVRRANAGRPMTAWADLSPEAQQALVPLLTQVVPMLHAVALNPDAHARAVATDG